jgi:N-acetylglutamate synthase
MIRNPRSVKRVVSMRNFSFPEDYPKVYDLWNNAGNGIHLRLSDQPEEIKKKIERDPDLFILAEVDGQIIGTVMGGFDGRRGMMYHLAVDKAYRERGIATNLVNELEKRLRAKGCVRYYLLVTKENQEAIEFYENLGWELMDDLLAYGKDLLDIS